MELQKVRGGWKYEGFGGGGKGGGGSAPRPVEAPDSLHSTSYARIKLLLSEGEIEGPVNGLKSVFVDNTPLENPDGSLNFSGLKVDFRSGTQDQDYIPGFAASEATFNVGVELTQATPWTRASTNTQLSAFRVTLAFQGLSSANTSTGDINGYAVAYAIDLATNGGPFTQVISTQARGKTTSTYLRSHRIDLPPSTTGWQLRVRRLTPNANSATISDRTFIQSVADVIDAKQRHPLWAVAGIQIDASQFSSIPTVSVDVRGRRIRVPSNYNADLHTYSGTWDGTFKISWTDNPAWIFYDLLTNERYGLGENIPSAWVDKWSLYQIGQYCDQPVSDGFGGTEPRFTCNVYLQVQADAYRVLQDLASVFRGMVYWGAGSAVPVADMPKDPVYTYTNSNVINGEFVYAGTPRKSRFTSALVSWNDPTDFGRQKVEAVDDQAGILRYGVQEIEVSSFGCTSRAQAQRIGRWIVESSLRETRPVSFAVGLDGTLVSPGQIINVADTYFAGRRFSGRLSNTMVTYVTHNGEIVTVELDPVTISTYGEYTPSATSVVLDSNVVASPGDFITVTLPTGIAQKRTISTIVGRVVTVTVPFTSAPEAEATWLIETGELVAQKYRVISIDENEGLIYTINAVTYDEGKFSAIDDGVRLEQPPISIIPPSVQPAPASITIDSYEKIFQGISGTTVRMTWEAVDGAVEYEVQWTRDNSDWVSIPRVGTTSAEIENAYTGQYQARVRAKNAGGVYSIWRQGTLTDITGILSTPPSVTALTTTPIVFGITLDWVIPNTPNIIERTEVWYSQTNNRDSATKLGEFAYPQQSMTLQGLAAGRTFYFWVRLVDKNGTVGGWFPTSPTAGRVGTSSTDATAILDYVTGLITETQLATELLEKIESGGEATVELNALKTELAAMYTIKTQLTVGGVPYMAGIGVGVENDEGIITSQILLAASRVAILDESSGSLVVPFLVTGGQVFINSAVIQDGSITNAKIGNVIQSSAVNSDTGQPVWKLDKTGIFEMNGVGGGGRLVITAETISVFDAANVLRVKMGKLA